MSYAIIQFTLFFIYMTMLILGAAKHEKKTAVFADFYPFYLRLRG